MLLRSAQHKARSESTKRGAFEGPELETVGGLRSRIVAFVEANQPKDEPAPEGAVPEVEAEPVEDSEES